MQREKGFENDMRRDRKQRKECHNIIMLNRMKSVISGI